MNEVKNVLVLAGANSQLIEAMFIQEGWGLVDDINDADLIQFVGGEDVDPSLYDQHKHKTTSFNRLRDDGEMIVYLAAIERGIPMAGICRGGQFLNVMNGGRLYQDVDNHAITGTHKAWLTGAALPIDVTSTHHQMMDPDWESDVLVLMTANESKRKWSMSNLKYGEYEAVAYPPHDKPTDIEALYYRSTQCLCFQPHPEFTGQQARETREVYFTLLDRYLFDDMENIKEEA